MARPSIKTISKWFLIIYIGQAVVGLGVGIFIAAKYGDGLDRAMNTVAACLVDATNDPSH